MVRVRRGDPLHEDHFEDGFVGDVLRVAGQGVAVLPQAPVGQSVSGHRSSVHVVGLDVDVVDQPEPDLGPAPDAVGRYPAKVRVEALIVERGPHVPAALGEVQLAGAAVEAPEVRGRVEDGHLVPQRHLAGHRNVRHGELVGEEARDLDGDKEHLRVERDAALRSRVGGEALAAFDEQFDADRAVSDADAGLQPDLRPGVAAERSVYGGPGEGVVAQGPGPDGPRAGVRLAVADGEADIAIGEPPAVVLPVQLLRHHRVRRLGVHLDQTGRDLDPGVVRVDEREVALDVHGALDDEGERLDRRYRGLRHVQRFQQPGEGRLLQRVTVVEAFEDRCLQEAGGDVLDPAGRGFARRVLVVEHDDVEEDGAFQHAAVEQREQGRGHRRVRRELGILQEVDEVGLRDAEVDPHLVEGEDHAFRIGVVRHDDRPSRRGRSGAGPVPSPWESDRDMPAADTFRSSHGARRGASAAQEGERLSRRSSRARAGRRGRRSGCGVAPVLARKAAQVRVDRVWAEAESAGDGGARRSTGCSPCGDAEGPVGGLVRAAGGRSPDPTTGPVGRPAGQLSEGGHGPNGHTSPLRRNRHEDRSAHGLSAPARHPAC